jgi:hypothetical protein
LLPNDQVLVAGGGGNSGALASAQLCHPAIGRWQRIADMNHSHGDHTATLLPNGLVLVAGGVGCNSAGLGHCGPSELYDPTTKDVDGHRQPPQGTLGPYGDVAAEWAGAGGRRSDQQ